MANSNLTTEYRGFRSRGLSALASIGAARRDRLDVRRRHLGAPDISYGLRTAAFGECNCRYIENVADGLRFVGFSDELAGLQHAGWNLDDDGLGETVRGAVWRLPAQHGRPQYVAGYSDPWNLLAAFVSFDVTDDATTAAIWADRLADRMAEQEREYQRAWQAGREFEDLAEFVTATRRAVIRLIRETREFCRSGALAIERTPGIRAVVVAKINSSLAAIRAARIRRAELADSFSGLPGWAE